MGGWIVLGSGNNGIALVCALIGGVIGAALCIWLFFLGIFLLGASAGAIVASAFFNAAGNQPQPILVLVLAIVFGVIALVMQKLMIIVSTAFSGSYLIAAGIVHLVTGIEDVSALWFNHLQPGSAGILSYVALFGFVGWFLDCRVKVFNIEAVREGGSQQRITLPATRSKEADATPQAPLHCSLNRLQAA